MGTIALVIAELRHRPLTAMITVSIIVVATSAVVIFVGLADLAETRTRLIQRDIGLNVRIIPQEADLDRYWLNGYADGAIDASLVERLEAQDVANRLVPMLQRIIPWGEGEALLTGIGDERFKRGERMKPVFGGIVKDEQSVVLGHTAAGGRNIQEGDSIEVLGETFTVESVLVESGSRDDIRIYAELSTVQSLLDMPGRLNEIRALECHCDESIADPEQHLKETLEPLLPGTQVIRQDREANARRKQRLLAERLVSVATPVLLCLAVGAIFGMSHLNASQRIGEIGLLASLGRGALSIALLVWMRAALLGIGGGVIGAVVGWLIVSNYGVAFVGEGPGKLEIRPSMLVWGGILGGAITSIGAIAPAGFAARIDPARSMREA